MDGGGYMVNHGIRGFGVIDMEKTGISHYFFEIIWFLGLCRFFNCTHTHRQGCAVKTAVENGEVPATRYESYLSLFAGKQQIRNSQAEKPPDLV